MDKKGQGISMNVIIISALALLVLVVLSIIFLGRTGQWDVEVVQEQVVDDTCKLDVEYQGDNCITICTNHNHTEIAET